MRLTSRLFALCLLALAPAVGLLIYNESVARRARESEVRELAVRSAHQAASELDRIIEGARNLLISIGEVDAVQALDTPACVSYLARLQPEVPHLVSLAALDHEGRLRCRQEVPPDGPTYADRSYFQEAITKDQFAVGEYTRARIAGKPVLPIAIPLKDASNQTIGVVAAAIDLSWLSERLLERGLPPDGSLTIADREGVIVARQPFPERFVGTRIPDEFRSLLQAPAPGARELTSQDGTRRVLGYIPLGSPPTGLYVSAGLSREASFAPIERATRQGLLVIGSGALLALGGALLFGRRFIEKPIQQLLKVAQTWRAGDLNPRTGLTARDGEIGALGEAFERVVDEVAAREGALRESEARFRELADSAPVLIWMSGPGKKGVYFNQPWLSFTGRPLDREIGDGWLDRIHPKDEPALAACREAFETRRPFRTEFRMRRHDGEWRWMLDTGVPRFSPDGTFQGFVGSCIDITERKQDEQRQRLLVNELNHRVKNTLTTVQSLAAQTLRVSPDLAAFGTAFEARLLALSKTHDLLTAQRWEGASLIRLVEHEVAPYIGLRERERLVLRGDDVQLPPKYAVALGLCLHELATNAVKYGALSEAGGRVEVVWHRQGAPGAERLVLRWTECEGPPVVVPQRRGFGSRLIERSIRSELQGEVSVDFRSSGLTVLMDVPLPPEAAEDADRDEALAEQPVRTAQFG
jgi:PAS domain S-box-containing protein